jgi:hypothetical protein
VVLGISQLFLSRSKGVDNFSTIHAKSEHAIVTAEVLALDRVVLAENSVT